VATSGEANYRYQHYVYRACVWWNESSLSSCSCRLAHGSLTCERLTGTMADSAAYEIFEVGVQRDWKGKSATRQFLDACVDFTGGVLGQYEIIIHRCYYHLVSKCYCQWIVYCILTNEHLPGYFHWRFTAVNGPIAGLATGTCVVTWHVASCERNFCYCSNVVWFSFR